MLTDSSNISHGHVAGDHIISAPGQPGQIAVHFMGEEEVRAAQGKAFRQKTLHRGALGLADQGVQRALLGTVRTKAFPLRVLTGRAAGTEMYGHLVHAPFFEPEHQTDLLSTATAPSPAARN